MNVIFTADGFRTLRVALATMVLAIGAAAAIGYGSYLYLELERRDDAASQRQLVAAQSRLESAKRERDDLRASAEVFKDLVARGILKDENRLDFVERVDRLKTAHRLLGLDYEIAPQRALPLAGDPRFTAVDVLGSRVKVTVKALHEGDALAFLEEFARPGQGFNPVRQCHLQRVESPGANAVAPRVEAQCTFEWISLKEKRGGRPS